MKPEWLAAQVIDYVSELQPQFEPALEGRDSGGHFVEYRLIKTEFPDTRTTINVRLRASAGRWEVTRRRDVDEPEQEMPVVIGSDSDVPAAVGVLSRSLTIGRPLTPSRRPQPYGELAARLEMARAMASARYVVPEMDWAFERTREPTVSIPVDAGELLVQRSEDGTYRALFGADREDLRVVSTQVSSTDRAEVGMWVASLCFQLGLTGDGEPNIDPYGLVLLSVAEIRTLEVERLRPQAVGRHITLDSTAADFRWRARSAGGRVEVVGPRIDTAADKVVSWVDGLGRGIAPPMPPTRGLSR